MKKKKTLTLYFIKNMLPSMFFFFLDEHNMEGSTIATKFSCKKTIDPLSLEGYKKNSDHTF